jgi:hypothetical protein
MRKLLVLSLFTLLLLGCATSQVKEKSFELKFKKIDHFMVDEYEVGVLEYEPYILPQGFIQRYHFPIYVQEERKRDFYLNIYGNLEDFRTFAYKKVSENYLNNQQLLWILEEKTEGDPHLVLKRYYGPVNYQRVKEDVIKILRSGK